MHGWKRTVLVAAVAAVAAGGCKGNIGAINTLGLVPDQCNSAQDALDNQSCYLTLGQWKYEYISDIGDQDWFSVPLGALSTAPPSIVHVVAGYFPPAADGGVDSGSLAFNTAVNLTVNVLLQDGTTSVAAGADLHGTAPPKPVDLTFRTTPSMSNTRLIIVLHDDTGTKFDNKQQYRVMVEVLPDPDVNEPNDTVPTPVTLVPGAGGAQDGQCPTGPCSGYLSTPNDVDLFSVTAPGANYVMYIGLSQDPSVPAPPPHAYRLQYYLYDPTGAQVAEGDAPPGSQYSANLVSIATAELLQMSGSYTIQVQGYRDINTVGNVPGDLNFKYLLQIIVVPLQDPSEGTTAPYNNTFATAYPLSSGLGIGASAQVVGRTSYRGDEDWYSVTVTAGAGPSILHYTLVPGTGPARFPELPTNPSRRLSVYTQVATTAACLDPDAGVCPMNGAPGSVGRSVATGACSESPPKCLESFRAEPLPVSGVQQFPNLRNFEAMLQVPPSAAAITYYFRLQPLGDLTQNEGYWADDKDYTLTVQHLAEPDPLEAVPDPQRAADMTGGSLTIAGSYLSFGPGILRDPAPAQPIVTPDDYDGRGDDLDSYRILLPATMLDEAWSLSYTVPVGTGTDPSYDLGFTLQFCDNTPDAGTGAPPCYAMVTSPKYSGGQLGLFYTSDALSDWWNTSNAIPLEPVYDRQVVGGNVVTTVRPYGCHCFEQRFVSLPGTYFVMNVFPVNRTAWQLVPYTITMGTGAYPYSFTPNGGGSFTCPSPCQFTYQ